MPGVLQLDQCSSGAQDKPGRDGIVRRVLIVIADVIVTLTLAFGIFTVLTRLGVAAFPAFLIMLGIVLTVSCALELRRSR